MIVDPPEDLSDAAGWRAQISILQANRETIHPDAYDAMMSSLNAGLDAALYPTPIPKGSIRERLSLRFG